MGHRKRPGHEGTPLVIGNNNLFEFHSRCESTSVGSENIFESKSKNSISYFLFQSLLGFIGDQVIVNDHCVIGAECSVLSAETLPSGTIISGVDCRRWTKQVAIKVHSMCM